MRRRQFLRLSGLGGLVAVFAGVPAAVASTVESCVSVLEQIRAVAVGSGNPNDRLAAIVALVDGEIGPAVPTISGDFAGLIPAGEVWRIVGDINLTGDMVVEGTLESVDTFTLGGNGFQILVQNGGRLNLAGQPKSAWVNAGDPVTGWQIGDMLAVAPTASGDFTVKDAIWGGDWASTVILSEDVTLVDGRVARPEVANLSQTARIHNVSRVMFHMGAGIQTLSSVAVVDSGVASALDFYPIHFHQVEDGSRGSMLTDVVVQGGRNHAFVPHSSHGVTFTRCAAIKSVGGDSFWWNRKDLTHDLTYDRCAVIGQSGGVENPGSRNTGFRLGQGSGTRAVECVASGVRGTIHSAGFLWPEGDSGNWQFLNCVGHNNNGSGAVHYGGGPVDGFDGYRNKIWGFHQATYLGSFTFNDVKTTGNYWKGGITNHGRSTHTFGDIIYNRPITDKPFCLRSSPAGIQKPVIVRDAQLGSVRVEADSWFRFEDCGLTPADFNHVTSAGLFEIIENGVEVHRYENGAWV